MLTIDGSQGEGGGQALRSSLTLAVITGKAVTIENIRARRPKPGLQPQHLQAVKAAAAICGAAVEGAALNSQRVVFRPEAIRPGRYRFEIGTAGSTSLVLQTIFLPLSLAGGSSNVSISGGTHVPYSPAYHYLEWHWLLFMERIGCRASLTLEQAGYYPGGGGLIRAAIQPAGQLRPLELLERGPLLRVRGLSGASNLDPDIPKRQKLQALRRLQTHLRDAKIKDLLLPSPSPGTFIALLASFESSQACFSALGAKGKPAARVADQAVDELEAFIQSSQAVDRYLADQLLLPLALASGPSRLATAAVTDHLLTNAEVIRAFLPVEITIQGEPGQPGLVEVKPKGSPRI
jgi:RNA 3'-phosphate cyclase